ncbi:MAG TPA: hypothetical protein VKA32_04385, partial [Gammaproteobacteria bacterium]|nr:hypothetical protein [Gammaproteobacteria bacterium]
MVENTTDYSLDTDTLTLLGLDRQPFGDDAAAYIDDELETKLNIAGGLLESTGSFVLVTGRDGVGKSRFVREISQVAPNVDMRLVDDAAKGAGALLKRVGWNSGQSVEDLARTLGIADRRIALAVDDAGNLPREVIVNLARAQRGLAMHAVELPIVLVCPNDDVPTLREGLAEGGIEEDAIH